MDAYFIPEPDFNGSHALLIRLANLFAIANPEHLTQWQCKEAIKNFLFCKGVDRSKIQALIIDQGHRLDPDCLEVLRELMNYETNDYKLLQIVIAGRPAIEQRLQTMPNLVDRVNLFLRLGHLGFKQTRALIGFQLTALAPGDQPALCLSRPACWMIHWASGGIPSSIVDLCRHPVRNFDPAKDQRRIGLWQFIRAYRALSDDGAKNETPTVSESHDPGKANDNQ